MVFGADGLRSMRSRCARFFPEDQIQLNGIEARVFDDLETERQRRVVQSQEKGLSRLMLLPINETSRSQLIVKDRLRPDPGPTLPVRAFPPVEAMRFMCSKHCEHWANAVPA
jgi:hypothetical protein